MLLYQILCITEHIVSNDPDPRIAFLLSKDETFSDMYGLSARSGGAETYLVPSLCLSLKSAVPTT